MAIGFMDRYMKLILKAKKKKTQKKCWIILHIAIVPVFPLNIVLIHSYEITLSFFEVFATYWTLLYNMWDV